MLVAESSAAPAERPVRRRRTALHDSAPELLPPLLLLAVAGSGIARPSMYSVEEATMWVARMPVHGIFAVVRQFDAVHAGYYLSIHALFRIFGASVFVMRMPSLVAALVSVALTARIARRLTGSAAVAALTGCLTAVMPLIAYHAVSGRSYAIDAMLVLAATLALLRAVDDPRPRRWLLYAVLVVLAGYLHEMTVLALPAHGLTLLSSRVRRRVLAAWAGTVAAALAALVPIFVVSHAQERQLSWVHRPTWTTVLNLVRDFFGPSAIAVALVLGLVVVGMGTRWPDRPSGPSLQAVAVPLFLLPATALLAESEVYRPLYGGSRYVLYSLPAAIMLAGAGAWRLVEALARARRPLQIGLAALALACVALAQLPQQERLRTAAGYDMDELAVARYVAAHSHPGDGAVYVGAGFELTPLGYPRQFRNLTDASAAVSPERSHTYYGIRRPAAQLPAAMRGWRRIWAIGRFTRPVGRYRVELRVLTRHFRLATSVRYHGIAVRLYVRDGRAARRV